MEGQIKCFPVKVKLKEFIITKPLLHEMLKGLKFKKIKTMNIKMAINSQLSTIESKKLSKQAEQKQNHRYGDHLGRVWREKRENGVKGTGIKKNKLVGTE